MDTADIPRRKWRFRLMNFLVYRLPVQKKHLHNTLLLRCDLARWRGATTSGSGASVGPASVEDLRFIGSHPESLPGVVYSRRIDRGDTCYVMRREGEILGYNWVSHTTAAVMRGFDLEIDFLELGPGERFTYDFYVYRELRGGGHGGSLKRMLLGQLAAEGGEQVMSLVDPENIPSLRVHHRLGYVPIDVVYGYRVGGWRRSWFGGSPDSAELAEWMNRRIAS